MKNIKEAFQNISEKYTQDQNIIDDLWSEIENAYQGRAYHNLVHIETMYVLLSQVKNKIKNWDVLMYAMFYHDIIYDSLRNDNERRSADASKLALQKYAYPQSKQKEVYRLILATKTHHKQDDLESALFMDSDLAILALPHYKKYTKAIRKEYESFSDELYLRGRKKVILSFLKQEKIYQSAYFFDKFEALARENLEKEYLSKVF
jgi:predicted metal-dependent HD superfamily phosphohydrolase